MCICICIYLSRPVLYCIGLTATHEISLAPTIITAFSPQTHLSQCQHTGHTRLFNSTPNPKHTQAYTQTHTPTNPSGEWSTVQDQAKVSSVISAQRRRLALTGSFPLMKPSLHGESETNTASQPNWTCLINSCSSLHISHAKGIYIWGEEYLNSH